MMKARSDTLNLGWREWAVGENKICKLRKYNNETLALFTAV